MRRGGVEEPAGNQVFLPLRQMTSYGITLTVRTDLPADLIVPAIRRAVWAADKDAAVWDVRSVDELLGESAAARRFHFLLLAVFGVAALLLAAIGVFGLAHRSVTSRSRELGVRMALGATRLALVRLVDWDGLRPAALGVALGLVASLWVASLFAARLYGVAAADPVTVLGVGAGSLATAVLATLGAAWRTTQTDPSAALRSL
jgi:putative ABC transport system permease protein